MSASESRVAGSMLDSADAAALLACQQTVNAFYAALDEGDLDVAFSFHTADLEFSPPGAPTPLGLEASKADAARVRHAYPGRRTLHVATSFTGGRIGDDVVEADYLMTVYELTRPGSDGTAEPTAPYIFALARERCRFRVVDGAWRIATQRIEPIAAPAIWGAAT